jgi:hypothetical protein
MADPFIGKISSEILKVATDSASKGATGSVGNNPTEQTFQEVMSQMGSQEDLGATLGMHPHDMNSQGEPFKAMSAEGIDPLPEWLSVGPTDTTGTEMAADMLTNLNQSHMKMEQMFDKLAYGSDKFSMQELLAMQAHMYMWSQEIELGVKIASEGVSSLRSLLNTQVQ